MGRLSLLMMQTASVPEGGAENMKEVKKVAAETAAPEKKRKGTKYSNHPCTPNDGDLSRCFRLTSTNFISLATEDAASVAVKKSKFPKSKLEDAPKSKSAKTEVTSEKVIKDTNGEAAKKAKSAGKELKSAKTAKSKGTKPAAPLSEMEDAIEDVEDDDEDSEIDDQTEALLKGFESDGDEEDAKNEEGLKEGEEVPTVPDLSNRSKKQLQKALDFKKDDSPGVVYVGRIPHGFYEHEMRDYFKQFGTILKLRLSRNKQTGASKHVAWIQFESSAVAEIVAKTMNNYLLFNHILKVKIVPKDQVPPNLFKGANKRFKKIPWNKIAGRELAQPKSEDAWEKQKLRVEAKRREKADKLKAIGMDYEFEAPQLKTAKGVAKKPEPAALSDRDTTKAIEAPLTEKDVKKKERHDKKAEMKNKAKATRKTEAAVEAK